MKYACQWIFLVALQRYYKFIALKMAIYSYLCPMISNKITPEELWARQHINSLDVDYDMWDKQRESIMEFSKMSQSSIFTVDVFKERYDFASDNFSTLFGYNPTWIKTIRKQGDMLEDRIYPDDRVQLIEYQIEHGQFIYSLPADERNDYWQTFQYRILNTKQQYINVISRQQVIQKDRNGKAWIIMGIMEISPDQTPTEKVKRTVINRRTGEILAPVLIPAEKQLTNREKEILLLIRQGFLSKEIADKLGLSIYTVNNHRKNILAKLDVDNVMEAINTARDYGIIY
jgi:DNA-binding CsgD family transcriptional regulator